LFKRKLESKAVGQCIYMRLEWSGVEKLCYSISSVSVVTWTVLMCGRVLVITGDEFRNACRCACSDKCKTELLLINCTRLYGHDFHRRRTKCHQKCDCYMQVTKCCIAD
jgi:hypothetical protein